MSQRRKLLIGALAALLVAGTVVGVVLAVWPQKSDHNAPPGTLDVGARAPEFSLPGVSGGTVSLAAYRGHPLILTFGASYCHPCHEEFPLLAKAAAVHRSLTVVGVDPEDLPGDMQTMMHSTGANWPMGDDAQGTIAARYGVTALPVTFFVAPDGKIVARGFGLTSQSLVNSRVSTLLRASA